MNFDNVVRAMSVMRDDLGFGLANKRVTLSTAGMVPDDRQAGRGERRLARRVAACARTTSCAANWCPLNKKYPIAELMASCERYVSRKKGTSITFEYTLMKGVNDQPAARQQLARLMHKFDNAVQMKDAAKVNLDSVQSRSPARASSARPTKDIRAFQKTLQEARCSATVRRTRGDDIDAACGQLKGQVLDRTRRQAEFRKHLAAQGIGDAAA
jgi:23S rRNA (adenine2503-C2)-methyltransferase